MCLGLSPSNKVVFASLVAHIKDKGRSLVVLVTETREAGQGCIWEASPELSFTGAYPRYLSQGH